MGRTVDYYFAPQSPWAYLGHQRLADIAQRAGASIRVMPIDLGGKVFPISGGLPLGQRAPQRQAYRLVELQRFSQHLNAPLNLKPRYFPVGGDDAARLIIAADLAHGAEAAMKVAGAVLTACWSQERNIADDKVLAELSDKLARRGGRLQAVCVPTSAVSVADAVKSYLFNSQLLSRADGGMLLIVPEECRNNSNVWNYLQQLTAGQGPIREVKVFDLKQSMQNGGGPACLRLRVALKEHELAAVNQGVIMTPTLHDSLNVWVDKHYRDRLSENDLADPQLLNECRAALDELTQILKLGAVYPFQLA